MAKGETAMAVSTPATKARSTHSFYIAVTLLLAVAVFIGFAPTFYLKALTGAPALSVLVWLHGLIFTAWIVILVTQPLLAANNRVDLHMRLGWFGAAVGLAMVIVGLQTAIVAARMGHVPPGAPPPLQFLAIPFFAIVEFGILFGAGILMRSNSQAHRRLMLLATVAIVGAAFARFPLPFLGAPPAFFAAADLFIVAGMIYDWRAFGRVHPAYIWGGLLIILGQPLQLMLMGTEPWLTFATWLTS
jgi:hypothetical protein